MWHFFCCCLWPFKRIVTFLNPKTHRSKHFFMTPISSKCRGSELGNELTISMGRSSIGERASILLWCSGCSLSLNILSVLLIPCMSGKHILPWMDWPFTLHFWHPKVWLKYTVAKNDHTQLMNSKKLFLLEIWTNLKFDCCWDLSIIYVLKLNGKKLFFEPLINDLAGVSHIHRPRKTIIKFPLIINPFNSMSFSS